KGAFQSAQPHAGLTPKAAAKHSAQSRESGNPEGLGIHDLGPPFAGTSGRDRPPYSAAMRTSGAAERTSASTCFSYLTKFSWNMRTSLRAVSSNAALSFQVFLG